MLDELKPHPDLRDAGLPWAGHIPAHWRIERGKSLFTKMDRSPRPDDETVTCFRDGVVTLRKNRRLRGFTESLKEIGYQGVRKGDLVIHAMDAFAGAAGVSDSDGKSTPVYLVCRPKPGVNAKYFAYLVREMARSQWILALAKGVRQRSTDFRFEAFGTQRLPVPPLDEQDVIVRVCEDVDRRINRLIRNKRRLIELLNEQKQAIITHAVTRGLDPSVPLKPSGLDWLGDVPKHWDIRRLKYLVRNINEQTTSKQADEVYIAMENVEGWTGRITLPDEEATFASQVKRFKSGDVLFGKLRPYLAKVTRVMRTGVCVGEFLVLRVTEAALLPEYLEHLLRSKPVIDLVNSSTVGAKMPRAEWDFIGSMRVAFPPNHEEQIAIARYIEAETRDIQFAIDRASREIDLIREYRTRLIADVVTGKVDVRHLAAELGDEPELDEGGFASVEADADVEELDEVMEEAADVDD